MEGGAQNPQSRNFFKIPFSCILGVITIIKVSLYVKQTQESNFESNMKYDKAFFVKFDIFGPN